MVGIIASAGEGEEIVNSNLALITGCQQGGAYWSLIKLKEKLGRGRGQSQAIRKVRFYYDNYDEPGAIESFQYPGNVPTRRVHQGMAQKRFRKGVLEFVVTTLKEGGIGIKSLEAPNASKDSVRILQMTVEAHNHQYGFDPNRPISV